MKKTRYIMLSVVLLLGFILGASVVAKNTGTSLMSALEGTTASTSSQINTAVAASTPAMGVADIAEKAGPAVVNIEVKVRVNSGYQDFYFNDPFFRQFFGGGIQIQPQQQYETGIGTGFLISQDGYIVTNQHVINNAVEINVKLASNKASIPARLVGQDYELDLAVLKIDGSGYPTLTLGNSDKMRVGDWVVAIGQPYGLDHTVTSGVISAKGRPISIEDRNYKNLIQTDAAINPGNSGGPLLNMAGQVIGINTAVNAEAQGIGFAIPINTANDVLKDLMNGQKVIRPYMGISMADINEDIIQKLNLPVSIKGVLVVQVMQGSPAATGGIKAMDIIQKVNAQAVETAADVQSLVEKSKVGQKMELQIWRNGKTGTLTVTLQAKP